MTSRLTHVQNRLSRDGIRALPSWFAHWLFWNGGLHHLVPKWFIEDRRDRAKYARFPKKYGLADPIIIYQMGKVGSRTVYTSLHALNLDVPVYHLHFLNGAEHVEKWVQDLYPHRQAYPMLRVAKKIRADMERNPGKRWNLISLVRAPVPHEISVYFHRLDAFFRDFEARQENDPNFPREVAGYFMTHAIDDTPTAWFELQVEQLFGIDVYATPFPRERGYEVYEKGAIRLLVVRLEDMNRVLVPAVRDFLNVPDFEIVRDNVGEDKAYGETYRQAVSHLKLSPQYLERKHSTRYARHFYSPEELAKSVARWTG
jgi:hypothetical protein